MWYKIELQIGFTYQNYWRTVAPRVKKPLADEIYSHLLKDHMSKEIRITITD